MANTTGLPAIRSRMPERTDTPTHGSRTITLDREDEDQSRSEQSDERDDEVGVLRLHGDMTARRPRVIQWDDSVVDNEHLNKKKSKICCIYHKPRAVGESSDEESSDASSSSSSSSDGDSDIGSANDRAAHNHRCGHHRRDRKKKRNPREVSPNAYERQPVYKSKD
ncbi:phosphatase inhibitor-domain-containing protein [Dichotomocladium elegans]|nr:phosphatase inhibitor-domain-containing protein [Dichotomocladium elegans]